MRLTRKGFRAWLESKHPRTAVARVPYDEYHCPIAKFLLSGGASFVAVIPCEGTLLINGRKMPLPQWAVNFGDSIDAFNDMDERGAITASRALRILDEVK